MVLIDWVSVVINKWNDWQVTDAPLTDEEIDELLTKLTSEEIEKLLEDTDPDDTHMPPSARLFFTLTWDTIYDHTERSI